MVTKSLHALSQKPAAIEIDSRVPFMPTGKYSDLLSYNINAETSRRSHERAKVIQSQQSPRELS